MSLWTRFRRVEAWWGERQPTHHRHVVHVPLDADDIDAYLAALQCPCGAIACEFKTFGLIVPQALPSDVWQEHAQAYAAQRRALDA